ACSLVEGTGRRNHHPRGCGVALEVVSHCPGPQGSSPELLRNNVGLELTIEIRTYLSRYKYPQDCRQDEGRCFKALPPWLCLFREPGQNIHLPMSKKKQASLESS